MPCAVLPVCSLLVLCSALLCSALPCSALLDPAWLGSALPCPALPCPALPLHLPLPHHTIPSYTIFIPYHIISNYTKPTHTTPTTPRLAWPRLALPCHAFAGPRRVPTCHRESVRHLRQYSTSHTSFCLENPQRAGRSGRQKKKRGCPRPAAADCDAPPCVGELRLSRIRPMGVSTGQGCSPSRQRLCC